MYQWRPSQWSITEPDISPGPAERRVCWFIISLLVWFPLLVSEMQAGMSLNQWIASPLPCFKPAKLSLAGEAYGQPHQKSSTLTFKPMQWLNFHCISYLMSVILHACCRSTVCAHDLKTKAVLHYFSQRFHKISLTGCSLVNPKVGLSLDCLEPGISYIEWPWFPVLRRKKDYFLFSSLYIKHLHLQEEGKPTMGNRFLIWNYSGINVGFYRCFVCGRGLIFLSYLPNILFGGIHCYRLTYPSSSPNRDRGSSVFFGLI